MLKRGMENEYACGRIYDAIRRFSAELHKGVAHLCARRLCGVGRNEILLRSWQLLLFSDLPCTCMAFPGKFTKLSSIPPDLKSITVGRSMISIANPLLYVCCFPTIEFNDSTRLVEIREPMKVPQRPRSLLHDTWSNQSPTNLDLEF